MTESIEKKQIIAKQSPWLNAWSEKMADIKAVTPCITTADLFDDGEYRLVVADLNLKFRVYKGTSIEWEVNLFGIPTAVVCF